MLSNLFVLTDEMNSNEADKEEDLNSFCAL